MPVSYRTGLYGLVESAPVHARLCLPVLLSEHLFASDLHLTQINPQHPPFHFLMNTSSWQMSILNCYCICAYVLTILGRSAVFLGQNGLFGANTSISVPCQSFCNIKLQNLFYICFYGIIFSHPVLISVSFVFLFF